MRQCLGGTGTGKKFKKFWQNKKEKRRRGGKVAKRSCCKSFFHLSLSLSLLGVGVGGVGWWGCFLVCFLLFIFTYSQTKLFKQPQRAHTHVNESEGINYCRFIHTYIPNVSWRASAKTKTSRLTRDQDHARPPQACYAVVEKQSHCCPTSL